MADEIVHGLYATYTNLKCRCPRCRKAAAKYMQAYRKTSVGKSQAKFHQVVANKRSQMAINWIKVNHPEQWDKICSKALKIVDKQESRE
jgi:phage FluMu protein Com